MAEKEGKDASVRQQVISGLKWTTGLRLTGQVITWGCTIFVIRFLEPADYGLKAMVTVLFSFLLLLSTAGIEQAIVQKKALTQDQFKYLFGILIVVNLVLCALQVASAPLVAAYYNEPALAEMLIVMSLGFVVVPFRVIPFALLGRRMEFKYRSFSDLVSVVIASVFILVLAINGAGVWALIWGQLLNLAINAIMLNYYQRWLCLPRFALSAIRSSVKYSGAVTLNNMLGVLTRRADTIVGGKLLGADIYGIYAVALHLASLPLEKIVPLINQVAFPAYSRLQEKRQEVSWYFLKSTRLICLTTIPIFLGMASVSELAVPLVLGDKWREASLPLAMIALVMPLRVVVEMYTPVLTAMGLSSVMVLFRNGLVTLVLMGPAFFFGARWGAIGLCAAWLIAYPIIFVLISSKSLKIIGIPLRKMGEMMLPGVACGAIMVLVIASLEHLMQGQFSPLVMLVLLTAAGFCSYFLALAVFFKARLVELIAMMSSRGQRQDVAN